MKASHSRGQQVPAGAVLRLVEADADQDADHRGRRRRPGTRASRPVGPGSAKYPATAHGPHDQDVLPAVRSHSSAYLGRLTPAIGPFAGLVERRRVPKARAEEPGRRRVVPGAPGPPADRYGGPACRPSSTRPGPSDLLRHEFGSLAALCSPLSDDQWDLATCLPGWTVQDVLSHVIGTESMLAGEPAPTVDISHLDHMKNPVAEANEVWVESMRPRSAAPRCSTASAEVTGRRLAALDAMTQADFDAPSWTPVGRDETYGRFMRIRHYDCFMHEHDIRDALGLPAEAGPAPTSSRPSTRWRPASGYIVGRRASMPEGSRVRIDLTGPVSRTYLVLVEGRATVVDSFDGHRRWASSCRSCCSCG